MFRRLFSIRGKPKIETAISSDKPEPAEKNSDEKSDEDCTTAEVSTKVSAA